MRRRGRSLDRRCRTPSLFRTPPQVHRTEDEAYHPVQREMSDSGQHNREWSIASWCPPRCRNPSPAKCDGFSPIYRKKPCSEKPSKPRRIRKEEWGMDSNIPLSLPHTVDGGNGAVFDDPTHFVAPTFEDLTREIIIYIVASAIGDFSYIRKETKIPHIHDIPKYREVMTRAATNAREPNRHNISMISLRRHISATTSCLFNLYCQKPFSYQEKLEEYLKEHILSFGMISSTKWKAFTSAFHILRNQVMLVKNSDQLPDVKNRLYCIIVDAMYCSVKYLKNLESCVGKWECYGL